ncbi:MAG: hypothetical protein ABJA87_11015, partial [bacterium]
NNDGESHNRSWNCGVEGETDDPTVLALRSKQQRNFLTTLMLSQGVPMLCHGDELGRTQRGNNNGYCQDNEITWIDWDSADTELIDFTRTISALRKQHPVFRRRRFFDGRPVRRRGTDPLPDIGWFRPDGSQMSEQDWGSGFGRAIAVYLNGDGIPDRDTRGDRVKDDTFLVCFSAHDAEIDFTLPAAEYGSRWSVAVDTAEAKTAEGGPVDAGQTVSVKPRAIVVLRRLAVMEDAPPPVTAASTADTLSEAAAPQIRPAPVKRTRARATA